MRHPQFIEFLGLIRRAAKQWASRSFAKPATPAPTLNTALHGVEGAQMERDYALIRMATAGSLAACRSLIENGARPSFNDSECLREAAAQGHAEVTQMLRQAGADVRARDNEAARRSAANGFLEILRDLHHNGADPRARDDEALREVAARGNVEILNYLRFSVGADIAARDNEALCRAAAAGHLSAVRFLLDNGADARAQNNAPLRAATMAGHIEVVRELAAHGADLGDAEIVAQALSRRDLATLLLLAQNGILQPIDRMVADEDLQPLLSLYCQGLAVVAEKVCLAGSAGLVASFRDGLSVDDESRRLFLSEAGRAGRQEALGDGLATAELDALLMAAAAAGHAQIFQAAAEKGLLGSNPQALRDGFVLAVRHSQRDVMGAIFRLGLPDSFALAAGCGRPSDLRHLLELGANLAKDGTAALAAAVDNHRAGNVRLLLDLGVSRASAGATRQPLLDALLGRWDYFASLGDPEQVTALLDHAAQPLLNGLFTLVVPTYNRPDDLNLLLRFLERGKIGFKILVLDSSGPECRERNRAIVAGAALQVELVEYDESTHPFDKFRDGVSRVQTTFCQLCADDDLIFADNIARCVAEMIRDPEVAVAHGYYFMFNPRATELMDLTFILYFSNSITQDDPLARLWQQFRQYQALTYGVYRRDVLVRVFDAIRPVSSLLGRELLSGAVSLVHGKMLRLPLLTNGRNMGPSGEYRHWHPLEWLAASPEGLFEEYRRYRDILMAELAQLPNYTRPEEETRRLLDMMHTFYLAHHAPVEAHDYIMDNALQGKDIYSIWPHDAIQTSLVHMAGWGPRDEDDLNDEDRCRMATLFGGTIPPGWPKPYQTKVRTYRIEHRFLAPRPAEQIRYGGMDIAALIEDLDNYRP